MDNFAEKDNLSKLRGEIIENLNHLKSLKEIELLNHIPTKKHQLYMFSHFV